MENKIQNTKKRSFVTEDNRGKIGRPQKDYSPNRKLIKYIRKESFFWIVSLILTTAVSLLFFLIAYLRKSSPEAEIIQPFFQPTAYETVTFILIFFTTPIILKIICNKIMEYCANYGKQMQKPLMNFIVSLAHSAIQSAFVFVIVKELFITGRIYEILTQIKEAVIQSFPIATMKEGTIIDSAFTVIILLIGLALVVSFIGTAINLFCNTLFATLSLFQAFILLPKDHIINNSIKLSNFHPSDYEKIKEIYTTTSRTNEQSALTEKDFEMFVKGNEEKGITNYRVVLKNGKVIAFYIMDKDFDELHDIKVHRQEIDGHNVLKYILEDYKRIAEKMRKKEIRVKFRNDNGTQNSIEDFLKQQGWEFGNRTARDIVTYKKKLHRGKETERTLPEANESTVENGSNATSSGIVDSANVTEKIEEKKASKKMSIAETVKRREQILSQKINKGEEEEEEALPLPDEDEIEGKDLEQLMKEDGEDLDVEESAFALDETISEENDTSLPLPEVELPEEFANIIEESQNSTKSETVDMPKTKETSETESGEEEDLSIFKDDEDLDIEGSAFDLDDDD